MTACKKNSYKAAGGDSYKEFRKLLISLRPLRPENVVTGLVVAPSPRSFG